MSTELPNEFIFRAIATCPECIQDSIAPESAVEQRNAPDLAAIELLRQVRENFTEMESYNPKLAAKIDAVLKTAAGG